MKIRNMISGALVAVGMLSSCQQETDWQPAVAGEPIAVRLVATRLPDAAQNNGEQDIAAVRGYRFEDGLLKEVSDKLSPDGEGKVSVRLSELQGTLYFLANAGGVDHLDDIQAGVTTLDEFLQMTVSGDEKTDEGFLMTGQIPVAGLAKENAVSMQRAVARVDVEVQAAGVSVSRVALSGVADKGFVWQQAAVRTPGNAGQGQRAKDFDTPLERNSVPLFYVYEQENRGISVEVIAQWDGGTQRLTASLPEQIRRNTVYTLKVYGKGASLKVEVLSDEWESGQSADSGLERKGLVDPDASELGEGVRVNENRDVVYIPYTASVSRIALLAEAGAEIRIDGKVEEATIAGIESPAQTKALQQVASVSVANRLRQPGTQKEFVYLDIYSQGTRTGRVTLEFEPNPVMVGGGIIKFDEKGECHFNRYIDGELGTVSLPEGASARIDLPENTPEWIKLEAKPGEDRSYRILGGWRPNDKEADGRVQTAMLTVTGIDGDASRSYTITRKNYGLPVVNIKGTWWCKYNLRGNVKSFEDQIMPKDDPAASISLADYLKGCSDEDLLAAMGDQYLAGNPNGLKLVYDDTAQDFRYEGYQDTDTDFGDLPATEMAPDGYQVPGYGDYRFFTWSNNSALPHGSNAFNNGLEGDRKQRFRYTIVERNASFKGQLYGPVSFYDFRLDDHPEVQWVLYGLGHQWDSTHIGRMELFFAICDRRGSTWFIVDSPQSSGKNDYYKFGGQAANKTRSIRCIKTPVEYIY